MCMTPDVSRWADRSGAWDARNHHLVCAQEWESGEFSLLFLSLLLVLVFTHSFFFFFLVLLFFSHFLWPYLVAYQDSSEMCSACVPTCSSMGQLQWRCSARGNGYSFFVYRMSVHDWGWRSAVWPPWIRRRYAPPLPPPVLSPLHVLHHVCVCSIFVFSHIANARQAWCE